MAIADLSKIVEMMNRSAPWGWLGLFLAASALMIWRLGALEHKGFEGTVLGTLIMPYCSGLSNLLFAFVMGRTGGPAAGALVLENCLVNNITNATLLLGLPALIWSLDILPKGKTRRSGAKQRTRRLGRLSLLLTLVAMIFFTGALWALARDGRIGFSDALVLVGVFFFWQAFHIFEVLKENLRKNRTMPWTIVLEMVVILACGYGVYTSIEALVAWIPKTGSGVLVFDNIGWLSGLLMVIPNALLALYYAAVHRPDVVYASQIGDGHICIPLCVGIFALFQPIRSMAYFQTGTVILFGAGLVHFISVATLGRLPRWMGAGLIAAYAYFLYAGLIS
jgi:cation:H+ antiporter